MSSGLEVTERNQARTSIIGNDLHNVAFFDIQTRPFYEVKADNRVGLIELRGDCLGCLVTFYLRHLKVRSQRVEVGCQFQEPLCNYQDI